VVRPHTGITISLKFGEYLSFAQHFKASLQVLNMVSDFVADDVGLSKIAGRAKFFQFPKKPQFMVGSEAISAPLCLWLSNF
jgi:hypothetical protein